jgi:hypothetical protein
MILPGTRSPNLKIQARNESMLRRLVQRLLCQIECGAVLISSGSVGWGPSCNTFTFSRVVHTGPFPALSFFFSPAPRLH